MKKKIEMRMSCHSFEKYEKRYEMSWLDVWVGGMLLHCILNFIVTVVIVFVGWYVNKNNTIFSFYFVFLFLV